MKKIIILSLALLLSACFNDNKNKDIKLGKQIFDKNCVACHGKVGEGIVKNWRIKQSDGSYPPPPLNGTAHTWHHSPAQLMRTINEGGIKHGGKMPAFKDELSLQEKQAVLGYLHSLWPENIQKKYDKAFNK